MAMIGMTTIGLSLLLVGMLVGVTALALIALRLQPLLKRIDRVVIKHEMITESLNQSADRVEESTSRLKMEVDTVLGRTERGESD